MAVWNQYKGLEDFRKDMDHLFRHFAAHDKPRWRYAFLPGQSARNYPLVNLFENENSYFVEALAPGLDATNIQVSVVQNNLTISGEKVNLQKEIKPEAWHRNERATGKFVRTIELPSEVDNEKIEAEYKNGILHIELPKAESAKPKSISVKVLS